MNVHVTSPARDDGRFEALLGGAVIDTRRAKFCLIVRNECAEFRCEMLPNNELGKFLQRERQRAGK